VSGGTKTSLIFDGLAPFNVRSGAVVVVVEVVNVVDDGSTLSASAVVEVVVDSPVASLD
jgi:hypothetical protein